MILPCICLSCDHVLLTYGNNRHNPGDAVACDCKAAREGRKAAGTYGLGWIFECKSCPHYKPASCEKTGELIVFDRDEIEDVVAGKLNKIIESTRYKVGRTFYVAGIKFKITASERISKAYTYSTEPREVIVLHTGIFRHLITLDVDSPYTRDEVITRLLNKQYLTQFERV